MKRKVLFSLFSIGGVVLSIGLFASEVLAFTIEKLPNVPVENDFTVGPAQNEAFLDPGKTVVRNLTITSRLGKEMNFVIALEDFKGTKTGETAALLLGAERGPYSLVDYLKPEITEFTLNHGERMVLPIEISIPEDAGPGGRYGAVIVSTAPPESEAKASPGEAAGAIRVVGRVAALYLVRVQGLVNESGFLREIRMADLKKFYEKGPFSFELLFENNGNVHLNLYGVIEIKNLLGKKIGEIEIQPWFAMPDSLRSRTVKWDKGLALGRYTATAKINRGYQDIIDEKSVTFWVLPWKIVLAGLILLTLIILFFRWLSGKFEIRKRRA